MRGHGDAGFASEFASGLFKPFTRQARDQPSIVLGCTRAKTSELGVEPGRSATFWFALPRGGA